MKLPPASRRSGLSTLSILALLICVPVFGQSDPARRSNPNSSAAVSKSEFVNPIGEGADPWVIRDPNSDRYLWCFSMGNRGIAIHASDSLTSFGKRHVVWKAPDEGPYSREIWAPELHYLDDRWYVYFAASDGNNDNHLAYVLQSETNDPLGSYQLRGPLGTGEGQDRDSPNVWAIDMTVMHVAGKRYAVWSGWDAPGTDRQFLYIAEMETPIRLKGPRVRLCDHDDYLWERLEPSKQLRGLHEGPQVFQHDASTALVYSCGASWLPTYKLGLLELVGQDPLDPSSWRKRDKPVFQGTESVFGVGHSCFIQSPDQQQWWHVYHAKRDPSPGWRRAVHVQPMSVDASGFPVFGVPKPRGTPIERPSNETTLLKTQTLAPENPEAVEPLFLSEFAYYGHHQFWNLNDHVLSLGTIPAHPVNAYRSGEKAVFKRRIHPDFIASVAIDFDGNQQARDAGILFRCTGAAVGYDAQRGYFAGLIPRTNLVILGKTDGKRWTELARATCEIDPSTPQRLEVEMSGSEIRVRHNGADRIKHSDPSYQGGSLGLRVVDTHARFSKLQVRSPRS